MDNNLIALKNKISSLIEVKTNQVKMVAVRGFDVSDEQWILNMNKSIEIWRESENPKDKIEILKAQKDFIDGRMPSWRRSGNYPNESNYALKDYLSLLLQLAFAIYIIV